MTQPAIKHPPAQPPRPSAADIYQVADAALAARDLAAADRALATLVAEYRDSRLIEQALLDRARIAHQRRDWSAARQHLATLAAMSSKLLAEPAQWLRCRVDVDARDQDARRCLDDYRVAFPRSPHDLDALALLARLAYASGGCVAATPHIDELALRYPRTTLAAGWRTRCPRPSGAKP
jgi:uncharacterized protein HemY